MIDAHAFHLGDERAHTLQRRCLTSGVDLQRAAAALQRWGEHLASVRLQHARGGTVDVREECILHTAGEHRDPLHRLARGCEPPRRAPAEIGEAEVGGHVVETAQGARDHALHRSPVQQATQTERLRDRDGVGDTAHSSRMWQERKERTTSRTRSPVACEAAFDLRTDLFDQPVVLDA